MVTMEQLAFAFRGPRPRRRLLVDPTHQPVLREQLQERLRSHFSARPFRLQLTDNRSTVLSTRTRHGLLEVRLHHMFLEASEEVLAALGEYLSGRGGRRAARVLDAFIARHRDRLRSEPVRDRRLASDPRLERIRDALGRAYLGGPIAVPIRWGRQSATRRGRRRRSIQLGAYSFEDGEIRIHPALSRAKVPLVVLVAVVYHELLHHVLGAGEGRGRRRLHTREFRERERAYAHHARVKAWEARNLAELLGGRRPR
jgi:hypothetical protein